MSKVSKLPSILFGTVNDIGKHAVSAQGATGFWDYVKDKLGYKGPKKSVKVEDLNPVDQYPEPSVQQETPFNETWKPGYRASVRRVKSEKENEGLMARLKKIFGKSSERTREDDISRREIPRSSEFETVGKMVEKFPHRCPTKAQFFGGCARVYHPLNFPARREAGSHRHMSLLSLLRAAVGLNPRKSKPVPIREPNAPPKPIRDDKREKKEKKPVVQTEDNHGEQVTRLQSAMMDERGNPLSEENFLRTEWGVRIKDQARKVDPREDLVETIEKPFYVIKPLWGVNIKHFKTRDEPPLVNTEVSNPDATSERDFNHSVPPSRASPSNVSSASPGPTLIRDEQSEAKSKVSKVAEHPSVPSSEISTVEQKVSEELSQDKVSADAALSDEVHAWQMVIERSKDFQKKKQEQLEASRRAAATVSNMFLQPEPPEPKLDFVAIPPIRKISGSSGVTEKPKGEEKRPVGGNKPSGKFSNIGDAMSKKLHTSSGFASDSTKISDDGNVPSKTSTVDLEQLLFTNLSLRRTSGWRRTVDIKKKENILNVSLNSIENYVSRSERSSQSSNKSAAEAALNSRDLVGHVQTIHPDVTSSPKQNLGVAKSVRYADFAISAEASNLVQEPLTTASTKLNAEVVASTTDLNIRGHIPLNAAREINTYELKNYAYLRPDEIKETRTFLTFDQKPKEKHLVVRDAKDRGVVQEGKFVHRGMDNSEDYCQSRLESPRTITKRIEAYVTRGARDEERRAQKALLLLKARDQQILLLERRVAQLENAATEMHALTLLNQTPTPDLSSDKTSYFSAPQGSPMTPDSREVATNAAGEKFEGIRNGRDGELEGRESKVGESRAVLVPELKLSTSPLSDSESDVFSTPVSPGPEYFGLEPHEKTSEKVISAAVSENTVYFLRNESPKSTSSKQTPVDTLPRGRSGEHVHQVNSTGVNDPDKAFTKTCNVNIGNKILSQISGEIPANNRPPTLLTAPTALFKPGGIVTDPQHVRELDNPANQEGRGSTSSFGKIESSRSVRLSPSVPWVRTKRRLRRKSRGQEIGLCTKAEAILRAKGTGRQGLGFADSASRSLPAVNNGLPDPTNYGRDSERQYRDFADGRRTLDVKETTTAAARPTLRLDDDKALSKNHVITQTTPVKNNEPPSSHPPGSDLLVDRREDVEVKNSECPSRTNVPVGTFIDRNSSKYWNANEEPAPQWLIEEALSRGREINVINRYEKPINCCTEKGEDVSSVKTEYEKVVAELEEKLNDVKLELEIANKKKKNLKEKFKRALQNIKFEAARENEILQEKIVQICSSVLEKFGPHAFKEKKVRNGGGSKSHKSLKRYGKLSKKLHRKLRSAVAMSEKLRDELAKTKELLGEKTRQNESLDKRFSRLKQELETTELNLNDLINENSSLRKKFEDTREWMELKIGKERNERNNLIQLKDMQKSREIINLKKKADEDFATITQLRNKLLRSESANANKGFLLNSYKSQLTDLVKEKEQGTTRVKELENDLSQLRNSNAQLKAKVSLLLNEKEKLASGSEKSEHDLKEKMESKLTFKYEQSMLDEIESMKVKCDELLDVMRNRMNAAENCSSEYSTAISRFLKRLNDHIGDSEPDPSFDDGEESHREAQKTACTILNMTPEELSGFMKGRPANKINSWLTDFRKITSRSNFSDALANFLFKKVSSSV